VTTPWFITKLGKYFATSLILCGKETKPQIVTDTTPQYTEGGQ